MARHGFGAISTDSTFIAVIVCGMDLRCMRHWTFCWSIRCGANKSSATLPTKPAKYEQLA